MYMARLVLDWNWKRTEPFQRQHWDSGLVQDLGLLCNKGQAMNWEGQRGKAWIFLMPLYRCLSIAEHPQRAESELAWSQMQNHLKFCAFQLGFRKPLCTLSISRKCRLCLGAWQVTLHLHSDKTSWLSGVTVSSSKEKKKGMIKPTCLLVSNSVTATCLA